MKLFIKILVWVICLTALGLLSWLTGIWFDWPTWGGFGTFFGIIALYFAAKYLRRYWLAYRSKAALARSEAGSILKAGRSAAPLNDLANKFKEAVFTLKKSSLKRFGNPLYVLPWYMVIGESGSGKSTAITRSSLKSTLKPHNPSDPIIQTLNCEWWFFNDAVIVDTAGRYVSPDGMEEDQAEWEKLLNLLDKYRPREGVNGIVLVIDVDRLLKKDLTLLEAEGQVLRNRIDQLIRLFDKRFPVYVLVTKCDKIFGFDEWVDALKDQEMQQAMGYLGDLEQLNNSENSFLDKALSKIQDRLKQLRLEIAMKGVELSPSLLLLPSELERLRPGLKSFLASCMGDSNYQEQPLLRGIFFSSGNQTGDVLPSQLGDLIHNKKVRLETNKGYFLRDFFGIILPFDRNHYQPTKLINQWRRVHQNIGLLSWSFLNIACLVFIFASYITTKDSITSISASYSVSSNQKPQDVFQEIEKLNALITLENQIRLQEKDWKKQWLFFTPSIKLLHDDIQKVFLANMYHLQGPYESYTLKFATALTNPDDPIYANALLGLIRRANQIDARLQGGGYEKLIQMPQIPPDLIAYLYPGLPKKDWQPFIRIAAAYTAWSNPLDLKLNNQLENIRTKLNEQALKTSRMEWLLEWADSLPESQPVTLQEFWVPEATGVQSYPDPIKVRAAFTDKGETRINQFLDEMGQALNYSESFFENRREFKAWYTQERFNAWENFAISFYKGESYLTSESLRREMLSRINTLNSPSYRLVTRMLAEFDDIPADKAPSWVRLAKEHAKYRAAALNSGSLSKISTILNAFSISSKKAVGALSNSPAGASSSDIKTSMESITALRNYYTNIKATSAQMLDSDANSLLLASRLFSQNSAPDAGQSKLNLAIENFARYRELSSYKEMDDQIIFHLTSTSMRYLINYALMQASCSIQNDWEKNVLWPSQLALTPAELNNQLFGAKGSVWSFIDGPIKPFIKQSSASIKANQVGTYSMPFTIEFLPFLNNSINTRITQLIKTQKAEALKGKTAQLMISPKPTGINASAKVKPYSTTLTLQCSKGEVSINNLNTKANQSLAWSPEDCGDATIQIRLENVVLVKNYPGPLGLARLLEDFQDGEKIFTPLDFVANKSQLDTLGVKTINVRYNFVGKESVLEMAESYVNLLQPGVVNVQPKNILRSFDVPETIGQCWNTSNVISQVKDFSAIIQERANEANKNLKNSTAN
jgi:type VI secretion system protein ImpL